ncbi:hypothetical protein GLAREA_02299 [Glarea lozoyensis ATCC 20868]|uniref:Secreted protein n=1 Tax=Glarea lozoyensis (strain ATCC 20868 / MF5171) TaxID=1116229 RepID=S3D2W2_GLAL2|nr:uncharacterized protein GLAREA_02299 [Glarea lozoyensis ATCC 20868]EPE26386.1 hypothetical protein GLAREA_02299 [Glarea lozoyensis ATCC 20868]
MQLLQKPTFTLLLLNLSFTRAAPMETLAINSAPSDAQAKLLSMAYSGSGCPQGSASKEYDAQINSGRWFFDGISAQIGPNVPISKSTQNCEVQLSIQTAAGWRFAVRGKNAGSTSMTTRVNLQDGVAASSITTYNIAGVGSQGTVRNDFSGPRNGECSFSDPAPGPAYPHSNCGGGILIVDHRVSLSRGSSSSPVGSIELYGDGGSGPQNDNFVPLGALEWERC